LFRVFFYCSGFSLFNKLIYQINKILFRVFIFFDQSKKCHFLNFGIFAHLGLNQLFSILAWCDCSGFSFIVQGFLLVVQGFLLIVQGSLLIVQGFLFVKLISQIESNIVQGFLFLFRVFINLKILISGM